MGRGPGGQPRRNDRPHLAGGGAGCDKPAPQPTSRPMWPRPLATKSIKTSVKSIHSSHINNMFSSPAPLERPWGWVQPDPHHTRAFGWRKGQIPPQLSRPSGLGVPP